MPWADEGAVVFWVVIVGLAVGGGQQEVREPLVAGENLGTLGRLVRF
ncbi:hypothetical protein ACQP1P_42360 [Dactylosporangium sp. CA-052675]